MTPERWQQIGRLFHEAVACEPAERTSFLSKVCPDDELRLEVQSLISFHEQSEDFIETPAADVAAEMLSRAHYKPKPGEQIGNYRIVRLLGTGGMGEVYLAQDIRLGRLIALKLLPSRFTTDAMRIARFEQEARAASALNHTNILTIYDIGETDSLHFIATEFIDGQTLGERISNSRLTIVEVIDIAIQVASALAEAHKADIVHRDIKPENIMVRSDGLVKVLDFGLAKLTPQHVASVSTNGPSGSMVKSDPGLVMGTPVYMSPEQASGRDVDARSDIWSLGMVIYEMVVGNTPFPNRAHRLLIRDLTDNEPPAVAQNVEAPAELRRIISKALTKRREERYQTAGELAHDLKKLKQEMEVERQLQLTLQAGPIASGNTVLADTHGIPTTLNTARPTSSARLPYGWVAVISVALVIGIIATGFLFYSNKYRNPVVFGEQIDSIAVLPFVNASGEPNSEYLSEAISDSIIDKLSRLPNLKVISLNSTLRYKGKQVDAQQVGTELKVRAVLFGRLVHQGDGLFIGTELVDVKDNRRLWGSQYDRKVSDIFAVQDEIARRVSEELRLRLTSEQQKQLTKRYTQSTEAYLLFNLGNYHFRGSGSSEEAIRKGIEYYEQALNKDPNYALAYTALATAYWVQGARGLSSPEEALKKAGWAAQQALEIDDSLAEAHMFVAVFKWKFDWDWDGADKEFKRALELDPNSARVNSTYQAFLVDFGKAYEALPYAQRADEFEERAPGYVAYTYFRARQYDTAIELWRKLLEGDPKNAHLHFFVGEAYVAKGMFEEGIEELKMAVALQNAPKRWDRYSMLAYAYATAGRREEALKILAEQKRLARRDYVSPYNFAIIYTGLGDYDRAFEYLNKAYEERVLILSQFPTRPLFDPLRSDPRHGDLLRRMNLQL